MRWHVVLCTLTLAACSLAPAGGFAADAVFCEDYAREAVHQAERARDLPYCEAGAHGPMWSMDYREHYYWCRSVPYREAEAAQEDRHEHLEACRHGYR